MITNSTCTCTYNGYPVPVYTISFGVTQKLMFLYVVEGGTQYLLLVYLASNFNNITKQLMIIYFNSHMSSIIFYFRLTCVSIGNIQ